MQGTDLYVTSNRQIIKTESRIEVTRVLGEGGIEDSYLIEHQH